MNKKSYSFPLLFNHSIRHRLVAFSILLLLSALFATTHAQPLHIAGSSTYYNELLGGSATNFGEIRVLVSKPALERQLVQVGLSLYKKPTVGILNGMEVYQQLHFLATHIWLLLANMM